MADKRKRYAIAAAAAPIIALGLINGLWLRTLLLDPPRFWLVDLTQWIVVPAFCLVLLARFGRVAPRQYGLRRAAADVTPIHCLAVTLSTVVVLVATYFTASQFAWWLIAAPEPSFSYAALVPDGPMKVLVVVYFAGTAGVVEEVAFRGLPMAALRATHGSRFPTLAYVLGTAALFGLIHWENGLPEVLATFVFGVVAALLYLRIRNLWPLVLGHAAVDVISFW